MKKFIAGFLLLIPFLLKAQSDLHMYDIIEAVSSERIEADIGTLANFGTRHTLSDTV